MWIPYILGSGVPTGPTQEVGEMVGEEWYTCAKCGFNYPRAKVLRQNGLVVCQGSDTVNCYDQQGYRAHRKLLVLPLEEEVKPLPSITEDL